MQKALTLSFHSNALEFSKAKRRLQSPLQKQSNLVLPASSDPVLISSPLAGEGMQCQQESKDPGERPNGVGSSSFDLPRETGPICLRLIARDSLLKLIALLPHLFMWLAQSDIYDSPIFHTKWKP